MKTTYPKKQKPKTILAKSNKIQVNFTEQIDEQKFEIDDLKNTITKTDLTNAGIKAELDEYAKTINLVPNLITNLEITNNHTNMAHGRIDDLEAKVDEHIATGGSGTGADLTEITQQVQTNTQNIADLQNQQTTNTADIATLLAFKESLTTPVDPYYAPKTFSDYPAGTILQGYAEFNRRYDKSYSSNLKTPPMIYTAQEGCEGTFKFKLNFYASITFTGILSVFNNNEEVYREVIDFNDESLDFCLERELKGIPLATGNSFYIKISANSVEFTLTNLWSCLIAPNAEILNYISPFSVEYFDGKYYISDCSSGSARYAEVDIDKIVNIENLNWIDTGIICDCYKILFEINKYGDTYNVYDKIIAYTYSDNTTFIRQSNQATFVLENTINPDWLQYTSVTPRFMVLGTENPYFSEVYYTNDKYINLNPKTTKSYACASAKCQFDYLTKQVNYRFCIGSTIDGIARIDFLNSSSRTPGVLGFGTRNHLYLVDYISNAKSNFVVYSKYYDKIIKRTMLYASNAFGEVLSTEEIGAYEEYFEGINNDYFVVKNGKLHYHKKPVI